MTTSSAAEFEIFRLTYLTGFISNPENFDEASAFALYKGIYPIHAFNRMFSSVKFTGFEDHFPISREFTEDFLTYVDELWMKKEISLLNFYKIEDNFGGHKKYRDEIIAVLSYTRISGLFDDEFWNSVSADAPAEALSIPARFHPKDILL